MKKKTRLKEKHFIPLNTAKNLMIKAGVKRLSKDSKEELVIQLEKEADKIIKKAIEIAENSKRTTITKEDIKIATEQ